MEQIPTSLPTLIWYLLMLACMIIGFFTTFALRGLVSAVKDLQKTSADHATDIAQLKTAHSIHHPGELQK
jgi:hypothetical protein